MSIQFNIICATKTDITRPELTDYLNKLFAGIYEARKNNSSNFLPIQLPEKDRNSIVHDLIEKAETKYPETNYNEKNLCVRFYYEVIPSLGAFPLISEAMQGDKVIEIQNLIEQFNRGEIQVEKTWRVEAKLVEII